MSRGDERDFFSSYQMGWRAYRAKFMREAMRLARQAGVTKKRVAIQEYLTAAIQDIEVLNRYSRNPRRSPAAMLTKLETAPAAVVHDITN